jgi:hypothetical protein
MMLAALALLLLAGPAEEFPDPIAPAAQGKLQCHVPDRARHTCQSLAGYRPDGKGGFFNTADVLLAPKPLLTMRAVSTVVIRDGAICGPLSRESFEKAQFFADGGLLDAEKTAELRAAILGQSDATLDRQICTRYTQSGDHLVAHVTVDGKPDQATMDVIWVSPAEGYRVAP